MRGIALKGPGRDDRSVSSIQRSGIALIDRRTLPRECLAHALQSALNGDEVFTFSTIDEWLVAAPQHPSISVILLCTSEIDSDSARLSLDLKRLSDSSAIPVIFISDSENFNQILDALENGARGYIPTSMTLELAVEAMCLVKAGGLYAPGSSLMMWRRSTKASALPLKDPLSDLFTRRQLDVLRALMEGKANKLIAHELKMREGTVKVHVRNLMKKLKATNRTEVAYKVGSLLAGADP